jgi:preprotein translocase subunit YajC
MDPMPPVTFSIALLAAADPPVPPSPLEQLVTFLPMAMIVLVAWLLLYRPERERMRRQQDLLAALKKNDRVLTTSGIYGTVANVDRDADRVSLRVDEAGNVKIAVTLSSIAKVLDVAATESGGDG